MIDLSHLLRPGREGLTLEMERLEAAPESGVTVVALPLAIEGLESVTVRAVAIV